MLLHFIILPFNWVLLEKRRPSNHFTRKTSLSFFSKSNVNSFLFLFLFPLFSKIDCKSISRLVKKYRSVSPAPEPNSTRECPRSHGKRQDCLDIFWLIQTYLNRVLWTELNIVLSELLKRPLISGNHQSELFDIRREGTASTYSSQALMYKYVIRKLIISYVQE